MSVSSSSVNRNAVELRKRTAWIFGPISKVADDRPAARPAPIGSSQPLPPASAALTACAVACWLAASLRSCSRVS